MALDVPILFCIFNRPDVTRRTLEAIRAQRPRRLLVVGDGPRFDRDGEAERVAQTRSLVCDSIDWPCELQTEFSKVNLGCRRRMSSGIGWAFDQAEELVILEDDCLPHPDFFDYCQRLLEYYRHDPRVMMISGDNFVDSSSQRTWPHRANENSASRGSYYFSHYAHIWGWASWRRAWQHYDLDLNEWRNPPSGDAAEGPSGKGGGTDRQRQLLANLQDTEFAYWQPLFDQVASGDLDTWDFSWQFAIWRQSGLVALPQSNLVANLGFGADATHTVQSSPWAEMPTRGLQDLSHPPDIVRDVAADQWTFENVFRPVEHGDQGGAAKHGDNAKQLDAANRGEGVVDSSGGDSAPGEVHGQRHSEHQKSANDRRLATRIRRRWNRWADRAGKWWPTPAEPHAEIHPRLRLPTETVGRKRNKIAILSPYATVGAPL